MSEDDLCFVWNCCDALEKAKERETVLRIAGELRDRFSPCDHAEGCTPACAREQERALPEPQCSNTEAFLSGENTGCDGVACPVHKHGVPMPAPESGVGFPPLRLEGRDGPRPQLVTTDGDWPAPEERLDLNDSDDWEREP